MTLGKRPQFQTPNPISPVSSGMSAGGSAAGCWMRLGRDMCVYPETLSSHCLQPEFMELTTFLITHIRNLGFTLNSSIFLYPYA